MTAANQGRDPTLGTKISEVVTNTTPIAPPVQIHQGNCLIGVVNCGGKTPERVVKINKIPVPVANEISDACNGCATFWPSCPLMLGWAPSKHPAAKPIATASKINPDGDKAQQPSAAPRR